MQKLKYLSFVKAFQKNKSELMNSLTLAVLYIYLD